MTIQRHKRSPRPIGSGRPRKTNTPPSSIGGPSVILELFKSADLQELSNATGLSFASDVNVLWVVANINEAFSNYANATAMQVDDSPAGERRDWCAGLARSAADLHRSLGHSEHSLFMEPPAFDAAESLSKGWPANSRTPEDQALREDLMSALSFALPDKYTAATGQKSEADFDGGMWDLLGRLGPALRALSLVAKSAQGAWGAETVRGRNGRERGRRYLMEALVPTFTRLFDRPPEASPGSVGFRWFAALIAQAGRIAGDQRGHPDQGPPEELQARVAALRAVEAIARHIAPPPYETETKGTAKLDHWIRGALAASGTQRTRATTRHTPSTSPRTREPKTKIRE